VRPFVAEAIKRIDLRADPQFHCPILPIAVWITALSVVFVFFTHHVDACPWETMDYNEENMTATVNESVEPHTVDSLSDAAPPFAIERRSLPNHNLY